jgi:hypothetical protein
VREKSKDNQIRLAEWTEKVTSTTSRDPLGLANRVSQRLVQQLLFGITAIGNRARYYSYSLWAVYDVMRREKPLSHKQLAEGIYWRDGAFVAACLIHHKAEGYEIDGAVGRNECSAYLRHAGKLIDLASVKHIESNPEGGFGLNYKGSLINLGFIRPVYTDESQQDTVYEVSQQPAIVHMVSSFEQSIKDTTFYRKYACTRTPVPEDVLAKFGSKVCLCLLDKDTAPERDILRDVLFERIEDFHAPRSYRPSSLRLILYCAKRCSELRVPLSESQFRTMVYYSQYSSQPDESDVEAKSITLNTGLDDIHNRWRWFFMHHYFSNALEGLFIIVLNTLSEYEDTGLTLDAVLSLLGSRDMTDCLGQIVGSLAVRPETTVKAFLDRVFGKHSTGVDSPWELLSADSPVSEEQVVRGLADAINASRAEGVARCLVTLLVLLERCRRLEQDRYWGWALAASREDPDRDISAPILYLHLKALRKDWLSMTLTEFLTLVIRRFVVEQHELMVPEKTAGTSWLTFDDGRLFYENPFDGPSPGSSRFGSALQTLCDLGLMRMIEDHVPQMHAFSNTILSEILI